MKKGTRIVCLVMVVLMLLGTLTSLIVGLLA